MRLAGLCIVILFATRVYGDPGFYPPDSFNKMPAMAKSAKKALRIYVSDSKPSYAVMPEALEALEATLKKNPRALYQTFDIRDPQFVTLLLRDLAAHDKREIFYVHRTEVGTAFFLKPSLLITARHVMAPGAALPKRYLTATTKAEARKALTPWNKRIILKDWKGAIVFDSAKRGHSIKRIAFSGHPAEAEGLGEEYEVIEASAKGQLFDLIALQVEGIDTTELEIPLADQKLQKGDRVYVPGFALACSGRKANHQAPDADGKSLLVSTGAVLAGAPPKYQDFLRKLMPRDDVRELYEDGLLFSDADFVPGVSGAPVLNEDGAVVSIASTVRHDPDVSVYKDYTVEAAYGPSLPLLFPLIGN